MAGRCGRSERWPRHDTCAARRRWATALFARRSPSSNASARRAHGCSPCSVSMPTAQRCLPTTLPPTCGHASPIGCCSAEAVETPEWIWFEENLAYDNARFCEALIAR